MHDQAKAIRDKLTAPGDGQIKAYTDPSKAATNRPCVLVTPPAIDWTKRSATWTLVALTAQPQRDEAAWTELDDLVAAVAKRLPVEQARPSAYLFTSTGAPVPAYLITVTTSH